MKSSNGVGDKGAVLALLRECAFARTAQAYEVAVDKLQCSHWWLTNSNLRNWFGRKWLPQNKVITQYISYLHAYIHLYINIYVYIYIYIYIYISNNITSLLLSVTQQLCVNNQQ